MTGQVELSAGPVEYVDTGGDGPVVVLLHGLLMDASLWDGVIDALAAEHRCIAPTLPLGAHRRAMPAGADLSLPAIARLVGEFLERLNVEDVTVVGNDTGGAVLQLMMADGEPRMSRAVLVSCDAFDNFPPGLTGRALVLTGKLPPSLFGAFMQQMRLRPVRRLPLAFGRLTRRGDAATVRWLGPVLHDAAVRRDTVRVLRTIAGDRRLLVRTADRLAGYDRPTLVVWASEDRVMPPEHGRRLATLVPGAALVVIADSDTLIPVDQPAALARAIGAFVAETGATAAAPGNQRRAS
jgi:pimeloyl-ACP methyl ester carboxylesterase